MKQHSLAILSAMAVAACGTGQAGSHANASDDGGAPYDASIRQQPKQMMDASVPETIDAPSGGPDDAAMETMETSDAPVLREAAADTGVTTGPQSCGFAPCVPGQPCPDLAVDPDLLLGTLVQDTRTFAPTDCAVVEGCILTPGTRKLLRFDTATENIGNEDLTIGDPTKSPCFVWSPCHQHYHFRGVAQYTLYQADGTTVAALGHKQGFCMDDVVEITSFMPPPQIPAVPYDCTNQGLHVGWEDDYPAGVDCQWIDITDVPPGSYIVSVQVNPQHYLPESNYDNNVATAPVTIK